MWATGTPGHAQYTGAPPTNPPSPLPPPSLPPFLPAPLQDEMKDRADCFDAMVEHEEKIRLDQAGWKERYYQVRRPWPVGGQGGKPLRQALVPVIAGWRCLCCSCLSSRMPLCTALPAARTLYSAAQPGFRGQRIPLFGSPCHARRTSLACRRGSRRASFVTWCGPQGHAMHGAHIHVPLQFKSHALSSQPCRATDSVPALPHVPIPCRYGRTWRACAG